MNEIHTMLVMMAALSPKERLIANAIKALNNVNDEKSFNLAAKECIMVFLKYTQGDKSIREILKDVEEKDKLAKLAMEFDEMTKDISHEK